MPSAITPASPVTITLSTTGPVDGDTANAASVRTSMTAFQTDVQGLFNTVYGGGLRRRIVCTDNNTMDVYPLGAVLAKVSATWTTVANTTTTTIDPETLAGGSFATDTRYYVYASISGTSIVFTVSTTAPDAGLRYMAADETKQFITTFYTDNNMDLLPYTQSDNRYTYSTRSASLTGNMILSNGTVAAPTSVTVTAVAPSTASAVSFQHQATATANNAWSAAGIDCNVSENIQSSLYPQNATAQAGGCFEIAYVPTIEYFNDATTTHTYIWVTGFTL